MGELVQGYTEVLTDIKNDIQSTQTKVVLATNNEALKLYWRIGKRIIQQQENKKWGSKVLEQMSKDLKLEFPQMKGLSSRSLHYMRQFYQEWDEDSIVQQPAAQLAWGHHMLLLSKFDNQEDRAFYAAKSVEEGWTRNVLLHHINTQLHLHEGKGQTNFQKTLDASDAVNAQLIVKDKYVLDFVSSENDLLEKELEDQLVSQIEKVMLELGNGFAFVGRQKKLEAVDEETGDVDEFYLDLLFYQIPQKRYVIVELKVEKFNHAHSGQINMYVAMVDDQLKEDYMNPTIGIVFCTEKNSKTAEYALSGMSKPIGVSKYTTGTWHNTHSIKQSDTTISLGLLEAAAEKIIESEIGIQEGKKFNS